MFLIKINLNEHFWLRTVFLSYKTKIFPSLKKNLCSWLQRLLPLLFMTVTEVVKLLENYSI